ncbi:MAG TPA: MBL fold metallo-hydrolase [Novosphingobium sp.]|nr:MBL fold metallo-hydrolase [Novosphingobium sp.]HQA18049.1 MBL fold metallo-hydrolase [Novosphingobium sp.]
MTRRLNWFLLIVLLVVGLPYYWLLIDNRPGSAAAKPVSIARLRELAASIPGQKPVAVEMELVAYRRLPGTLFVAGTGIKRRLIGVMAFRLPVPGKGPIVIDSGLDADAARRMEMEEFDPRSWARITAALNSASQIVITHEHPDHLGGLISLGKPELFQRTLFNARQLPGNSLSDGLRWPRVPLPAPAIAGAQPVAIAPGVVVIPAPSHTPGSQMIFVQLADGREYLFTGDIATLMSSWSELRARSRLVGDYLAPEARGEVFAWLKTIAALKAQAPAMIVVPGHDFERLVDIKRPTGIHFTFTDRAD